MSGSSFRRRNGFQSARKAESAGTNRARRQQGVDKVEIGLKIAFILANGPDAMHLGDIAKAANLAPSKAHRFLVSLCRSDIVEQDSIDGKYRLGGGAISLGLAAQNRLDEFRLGEQALRELHEKTGKNSAIVAWGDLGPTVVRRIEPFEPVTVSSRIGSAIPVLNSASGRVFAAFLPEAVTRPVIERELKNRMRPTSRGKPITMARFEKVLDEVRTRKTAEVYGDFFSGFDALSAPVFDSSGHVPMVLSMLATAGEFSSDRAGKHCRDTLVSVASRLTAKLGGTWPP
ncbi:IclR family transcriptional regulator [Undibacter mobilis]|uniref:IclR family transcriptional regulator n=1 Tax=Undibacter mobilis TaxID=2292256 RepID=A0A371B9R2_9BRAD|nr:IclR family transcriptional regulator [Undibacter mobilis]RDV04284.1 IclR family transcriptional regulator [Undibacter mobilis]